MSIGFYVSVVVSAVGWAIAGYFYGRERARREHARENWVPPEEPPS